MIEAVPAFTECGVVEIDDAGEIVEVTPDILDLCGHRRGELVGRPLRTLLELRMPMSREHGARPTDAALRSAAGRTIPVVIGALPPDGGRGTRLAVFDVSPGSAFERGLAVSRASSQRGQERLRILLGASVGFAGVRAVDEAASLLVDIARRAYRATWVSVHLLDGDELRMVAGTNPLRAHWPEGDQPTGNRTLLGGEVLLVRTPEAVVELAPGVAMDAVFRAAGVESALSAPMSFDGSALGVFVCYFDHPREFDDEAVPLAEALAGQAAQAITRVRLEHALRRAAMHDEVTALPNRRLVENEVERMLARGDTVALVFVDLDGFKAVNDSLGHAGGDVVLREVGRRLQAVVGATDAAGRFGGDEFLAAVPVDGPERADDLAEAVRAAVGAPFPELPPGLTVAASIGVAVGGGVGVEALIRAADQAMYEAKAAGGDRVVSRRVD